MNSRDHNTPKLKRKKYLPLLHQYALQFNGTDEYLTRALPTNLLTGKENDFYPAGSRPAGWLEGSGETWNQVGISGSTTSMVLKLAGSSARAIYGGLTIGQKYKMRIRWYGDSALNIGSVAGSGDYFIIAATTQWNTVIVTFTAVSTSISFGIASGTGYIDFFNFTPDWKLDLNESWELIKHSNNRTFADAAIDWVGSGNHSAARSTVDKYEGVASLLISASGAGDFTTNYVSLPITAFESLAVGNKYTWEKFLKSDTASRTLSFRIGTKTVTSTIISTTAWTKVVLNFLWETADATALNAGEVPKMYLSGAGNCYVDGISLTQAYDSVEAYTIKPNTLATQTILNHDGFNYTELRSDGYIRTNIGVTGNLAVNNVLTTYTANTFSNVFVSKNRTDKLKITKNGVTDAGVVCSGVGKIIYTLKTNLGANNANAEKFAGLLGAKQIIRFNNISQSDFNPTTYKIGQPITGGGAEVVLWLDPKNGSSIANMLQDYSGYGNNLSAVNMDLTNRIVMRK